jgi:hypothetical protein
MNFPDMTTMTPDGDGAVMNEATYCTASPSHGVGKSSWSPACLLISSRSRSLVRGPGIRPQRSSFLDPRRWGPFYWDRWAPPFVAVQPIRLDQCATADRGHAQDPCLFNAQRDTRGVATSWSPVLQGAFTSQGLETPRGKIFRIPPASQQLRRTLRFCESRPFLAAPRDTVSLTRSSSSLE